jgi:hypothetical protein
MSVAVRKLKRNPVITLETMHAIMNEVEEYYQRYKSVRDKLRRQKPGSEAYLDTLPHAWVALATLGTKVESAALAIDEFEDALPDEPAREETTAVAKNNSAGGRLGLGAAVPNGSQSKRVKQASKVHN